MLIWLPPSEGKAAPLSGAPLDLSSLLMPQLTEARHTVMDAVHEVSKTSDAAAILGLGTKSAAEAAHNLTLTTSACAPAIDLYTGVLFDHLSAHTLDSAARRQLMDNTWIMSALFGVVRPGDPIPPHRLAMGVKLPALGSMASFWRKALTPVISSLADTTLVDCRPGAYKTAYPAPEAHVIDIAVVEERAAGRKVITHMAKKWRGITVRHLVQDATLRDNPGYDAVVESISRMPSKHPESIRDVEVGEPQQTRAGGSTTRLTLVTASTESVRPA